MHKPLVKVTLLTLLLLAAPSVATAAVIDQSYDPGAGNGGYYLNSIAPFSQTFQAGLSGELTQVDVRVLNYFGAATAPLDLEVWSMSPTYSDVLVSKLATASISNNDIPSSSGFISFDLSSVAPLVTAGQSYAILLSTASNYSYLWEGATAGTYANGYGGIPSGGSLYYTLAGADLDFGFKTYVAAVPEPATLGLGLFAALAVTIIARRRGR